MRPVVCAVLLTACVAPAGSDLGDRDTGAHTDAGSNGNGGGSGNGGNGGGDDPPPCADVCWTWLDPEPATRPVPGPPAPVVLDRCNAWGVEPGTCPDTFTCGSQREIVSGAAVFRLPLCEPDGDPPLHLVLDLAPPALEGREVELVFTLSGAPWPGGGAPGRAGELHLTRRADGVTLTLPLPVTASGTLATEIPKGTWDVRFAQGPAGLDDTRWPHVARTAVLVVASDGVEEVDVPGVRVPVSVTLDGAATSTVPATTSSMTLSFWSPTGGTALRTLGPGDRVDAPIVLAPDTWDVTVGTTASDPASPFPSGSVASPEVAVVEPGAGAAFRLPLRTGTISGTVRVNGAALPAGASSYVKVVGASGSTTLVAIGSARPARYAAKVYRGAEHAVWLASYADGGGLPEGELFVRDGVAAGDVVDIDAPTVVTDGEVTFGGKVPTGYSRAEVRFEAPDGSFAVQDVEPYGAAAWSGLAWERRGDVVVSGNGETTPGTTRRFARNAFPGRDLVFDLQGSPVEVTVRLDGAHVEGTGSFRGVVDFQRIDGAGRPLVDGSGGSDVWGSTAVAFTQTGNLVATTLLPDGSYLVSASTLASDRLPGGVVTLGRLDVHGATTETFDARTLRLGVELLEDGEALPATAAGTHRGQILAGGGSSILPRTGRSLTELWLYDTDHLGVVIWSCSTGAGGCGLIGRPAARILWYGLDL